MKKNMEKEDIFDKIGIVVMLLIVVLGSLLGVFYLLKFIFSDFISFAKLVFVIAIICGFSLLICRKSFAAYLVELKENKKKRQAKEALEKAAKEENEMKQAINAIQFANKPYKISENQKKKLLDFQQQARTYICNKYFLANCIFPSMTDEELYTLLFINHHTITVKCYKPVSEEFVELYLKALPNNGFEFLNEKIVSDLVRPESPISKPYTDKKKKRTSNKVKRLRAERKAKKDANIIIKNGKKHQKPNYPFLAKEWTIQNMGYLNKLVMDETKKGNKQIVVIVPTDKLPDDRNVWGYIGGRLKDDDEVDNFVVVADGLKLIIESN